MKRFYTYKFYEHYKKIRLLHSLQGKSTRNHFISFYRHHALEWFLATVFPRIDSFLKVQNVELFMKFPHYGNFLLHKLNSCGRNYWRGETIQVRKLFAEIWYLFRTDFRWTDFLGQIFGRQIFGEQIFGIRFSGTDFKRQIFWQGFDIQFKAVLTLENLAPIVV